MQRADFLMQHASITVRRTYVRHAKVSATCETVKILIRNSTIIRKSVPSIKCKFINICTKCTKYKMQVYQHLTESTLSVQKSKRYHE